VQCSSVARGHSARRTSGGDLGKTADVAEQQWLAKRKRREQHARLVDLAVGQHDQIGPLKVGRQLRVSDETRHEAHIRWGCSAQGGDVHTGHPGNPQLGVGGRGFEHSPCLEQHVDPLVRTHQAEAQHDRPVGLKGRRLGRNIREVRKDTMGNHMHSSWVDAQLACQALAAVLGVHDDRIEAFIQTSLCGALARAGLPRHDIVGSEHERTIAWQQVPVEVLNRKPLEVHDIRRARHMPVAEHVRNMLRELGDTLSAGAWGKARGAIEQLAPLIPAGERHGAVSEATREQLDLRPLPRQRAAQRMVVRRRVGGGIDDMYAHRKRQ
jgi:hypothetical protein